MPHLADPNNHGLVYEGIIPAAIVAGGPLTGLPDLLQSGNWEPFLPVFEGQYRFGMDSMNCVQCSLLNVVETQANYHGRPINRSERHLYHTSGCTEEGNTFSNGYGALKSNGASKEESWPWNVPMTREVYGMTPPAMVKAEGLKLLDAWEIGNLRYVHPSIEQLRAALKKGPIWFCNMTHAMCMYKIDDRIRVFDTYPGPNGDGKGSFPLEYANQIVAAYLVPFNPVKPMPNIVLPDNCYVTGIFQTEQKHALHFDGKLIIGGDLFALEQWIARNEEQATHRFNGGPVRTISESDWNSFPHINPKGEPLP